MTEDNGTQLVSCVAEIVPGKGVYFVLAVKNFMICCSGSQIGHYAPVPRFVLAVKNFMICCSGSQSGHYAPVPREPHQFSKGPQGNDGKLGGHSNFGVGHRDLTVRIKYFKFKTDNKGSPLPCIPEAQKSKIVFYCFSHALAGRILFQLGDLLAVKST